MEKQTVTKKNSLALRKKAEKTLRKLTGKQINKLSNADSLNLIHELQVHQIELEMQNEELRTAQEALEDSRSRYSDLYDFAPIGYFTFDNNGLILEANMTAAEQLGIERKFLIKKPFSRFIHKDDADVYYLHRHDVLKSKKRMTCEVRIQRRDKTEFYAQIVSSTKKDGNDNTLIRSAVMNITERTLANEIIRQSEEKYKQLLTSISDGIIVLDRQWRYVLVNEAVTKMTDKSREELLDNRIMDVFPGIEKTSFFKAYQKVIKTGKPVVMNDAFTFEDGRKGWYEVHVYPVPEGIFIIVTDITDRMKLEEELIIKQRLNKLLIDSLPHSAMLIRKDRTIIAANKVAEEAGAVVGGNCWQEFGKCQFISEEHKTFIDKHRKIPDGSIQCYFCNADEALKSRSPVSFEVTAWDRLWDTYWIPLEEETFLHYAIDITDRKKAEAELEKHRKQLMEMVDERTSELQKTNEELESEIAERKRVEAESINTSHLVALGELAAGVAHEINNPINGIINYAQMLANKSPLESKEHDVACRVIKEGDRIANIVSSLLSFAREVNTAKERVRIMDIISESIALTQAQFRSDWIHLTIDIPESIPDIIAQPQQIEQVFLNIISNARYALNQKYTEADNNKILKITAEEITIHDQSYVQISFYDSGQGIQARLLDKIMNPFFTNKPSGDGTGLGLSISHGIINDHNGRIIVDSEEGEYTEVIIDLPVKK